MHRNWNDIPHNPTVRMTFPSSSLSFTSTTIPLISFLRSLFRLNETIAGVITVLSSDMIDPDALAMVMDDNEKPISRRYVISVAEYARTVSCNKAAAIEAGHMETKK